MRQILFRGKDKDNGNWYEGYYYRVPAPMVCFSEDAEEMSDEHYIVFENPHYVPDWNMPRQMVRARVIPETIGQYTGLTDKNGKRIFEGDIVVTEKFNTPNKHYVITYDLLLAAFIGEDDGTMYFTTFDGDSEFFEVVGNIHDNPELLKGGAE